jgi:hypothetical protein
MLVLLSATLPKLRNALTCQGRTVSMPYFSFGDKNATFSLCCIVECMADASHLRGERMPARTTVM